MLLTIEKILILKSINIFSEIPVDSLVELASILEEVEMKTGAEIFKKGDVSTAMYIVVEGRVRIHDDDKLIIELGEREVFGEMAALDPVPRSASVTAVTDGYLFRMERTALYELMSQHIAVAQGIIRVLCRRIRASDELLRNAPQGARGEAPVQGAPAAKAAGGGQAGAA